MTFKRPAARKSVRRAPPKSRYAGVSARSPRPPRANPGAYRFGVLGVEEGANPGKGTQSVKIKLEIQEIYDDDRDTKHSVGDVVFESFRVVGSGSNVGLGEYKAFVMAVAGFEDEAEYDEFDPDGHFMDAATGAENAYSEDYGLEPLVGREVFGEVMRGRDTADGSDFYRNYAWEPAEECITE